jgi:hypothetical protein
MAMAVGERFRGGGARGIAKFLAEHQYCDAGFDVRRESGPGSGRLKITCKGCGKAIEYRAAEAGELAAGGLEHLGLGAEDAAPAKPEARAKPTRGRRPPTSAEEPSPEGRDRGMPGWIPAALTGTLIVGGLALIMFGMLRSDDDDAPVSASSPTTAQTQTATVPPTPAATPPPQATATAPSPAGQPAVRLRRQTFPGSFTIGVAPGWETGTDLGEGTIEIAAPGGAAEIDVYFESGERPAIVLAHSAADFLRGRHDGEQPGAALPYQLGDVAARRIEATHPQGTEVAVVLSEDGYSYLIISSLDRGAPERIERQAEAELASFRT